VFTRAHSARRPFAVIALVIAIAASVTAPASARSPLQTYRLQEHRLVKEAAHVRRQHLDHAQRWTAVIRRSNAVLGHGPGRGGLANPNRWKHLKRLLRHDRWVAIVHVHRSRRAAHRQLQLLATRRASVQAWIDTWGIFEVCPIQGWNDVADNFGITVRLPGVPVHRHTGNDILALSGTPIVAPFDGYASASRGWLGGMEVRVHGARGYVYNAHLSRYGTLGDVHAGDVIGYVGSTGDATTPHDHFEWHPNDGSAVDPNPYLSASCGG
jgi:murein DD-endopeptidase MepM/ murein hydrolase activator NlpD